MNARTRTKIICTIGPSVNSVEKMVQLIDAGMNVARLNFSHGTQEEHLETIEKLKKARELCKVPMAIMLDTKGPEIRIGKIKNDLIQITAKQRILLVKEALIGDEKKLPITPPSVIDHLEPGCTILIDDGYIICKVVEVSREGALIEFQNAGVIKSHKGVNLPGIDVDLPAMTAQDVSDISFGCLHDVDLIAASFIRSADHVRAIKELLVSRGKSDIHLLAKIENRLGVQNFDSILFVAYGIMVARGDLGVELPIQEVPTLQKMMIRKSLQAGKPVVTATQMLESMIKNPRPTRAEASDVANAVYDSTSAVMLSGETAVGAYPIETVKLMRQIIEEAEKDFPYRDFFYHNSRKDSHDISTSISSATVKTAYSSGAKAIFASTNSGFTARLISRFRPEMPIVALTANRKTYHQLALNWGVIAADPVAAQNVQEAFSITSAFARKHKIVEYGDLIVLTAGAPFGVTGTTNMMIVESIGNVLVRSHVGSGKKIHGKIAALLSAEDQKKAALQDCIVVISHFDERMQTLLKEVKGIILENDPDDAESERKALLAAKSLGIPIVVRADGALQILQDGQFVTLDPQRGLIYKGNLEENEEQWAPGISDPKD